MDKKEINQLYDWIKGDDIPGDTVADLFLNYHGTSLVDEDFIIYISDEGYDIEDYDEGGLGDDYEDDDYEEYD